MMVLRDMNLNFGFCDDRKEINVERATRDKIRNMDHFVVISLSETMQSPS